MKTKDMYVTFSDSVFDDPVKTEIMYNDIYGGIPKGKKALELGGSMIGTNMLNSLKIRCVTLEDGSESGNLADIEELAKHDKNILIESVEDYIERWTPKMGVIYQPFLDFCGGLSVRNETVLMKIGKILDKEGRIFITLRKGREIVAPKGSSRGYINMLTVGYIKMHLEAEGKIKVEKFYEKEWLSQPKYAERKKKGKTAMIVYGFTYKKI